jgi:hypothetical protein
MDAGEKSTFVPSAFLKSTRTTISQVLDWKSSDSEKAWAKNLPKPQSTLPIKLTLSGDPLPQEHLDNMGKYLSEDLTCNLCSNLSNDGEKSLHHSYLIPLACLSNEHITNVNALIDTDAFQSNNVSRTIAKLLKIRGARKDNKDMKICSGICAQTNEIIYFDIKM